MPVLNEDTFELMSLIEADDYLYQQCERLARRQLGWSTRLFARIRTPRLTTLVHDDLEFQIRFVIAGSDNYAVLDHLRTAVIDWRDVAREFMADALSG